MTNRKYVRQTERSGVVMGTPARALTLVNLRR
jgi:hypothetical protein